MLNAAISGALDDVEYLQEPVFGLSVPQSCPGVPSELLMPRNTWADPVEYDRKSAELKQQFDKNFEKFSRN
jgi:phosphoenolpyruvate carboxykinase (ATP)